MAAPNVSDIIATTIEARSGDTADSLTLNNAFLAWLKKKGRIQPEPGGRLIYEEILYPGTSNSGWYSGYDTLTVGATQEVSAAEFLWKQASAQVIISGLELGQNSGKERIINLVAKKVEAAEGNLTNLISEGLYSDGLSYGGKQITGIHLALPVDPTTGTYGGINRATAGNEFWRSQVYDPAVTPTSTTIQGCMNTLWASCVRGPDRPDLILSDSVLWPMYMASLQTLQRFTESNTANLGFPSIKFMDADVVLDGGVGGYATASTMYFLNTKYFYFKPHKDRNMVPLSPGKRYATNQDAEVQIIGWMGNLTCAATRFSGRLVGT